MHPPPTNFEAFRKQALAAGFETVLQRDWPAGELVPTHTHPFAVQVLLTAGDMWLTVAGETRQLRKGDHFELAREVPHAERYGDQGASFWVARRP